jgi:hypothetical protein
MEAMSRKTFVVLSLAALGLTTAMGAATGSFEWTPMLITLAVLAVSLLAPQRTPPVAGPKWIGSAVMIVLFVVAPIGYGLYHRNTNPEFLLFSVLIAGVLLLGILVLRERPS